jgi:sec-independent protein translocase protein TatA
MNVMLGLFNLGGGEIILILALVLILFGAKKLPELAKGLGTGIKEFKKATREVTDEIQNAPEDTAPPARRLPPQNTQSAVQSADSVSPNRAAQNPQPEDRPAPAPSTSYPKA